MESLRDETAREAEHLDPKLVSLFILFLVLSSLLNGAVLNVIYHQRTLQEYMRVLYQLLTASDLILVLTWSLWSMLWITFSDHTTCSVASMVFSFLTFVALWSVMICLCGISFNLYLLVTRPLRYHTIVTRKRFFCILAGTYLAIVLVCGIAFPVPESPLIILLIKQCQSKQILLKSVARITYAYQAFPICATILCTTVIYANFLFIARQKGNEVESVERPRDNVTENVGMDQKPAQPQNRADLNVGCNAGCRQRRTVQRIGYDSPINVFFLYRMDTFPLQYHQHEDHIDDYFEFLPID